MPLSVGSRVPIQHNMVCAEAYLRTKWQLDPSSRLATTDMCRKLGRALPLFLSGGGRWLGLHPDPSNRLATHGPKIGGCAPNVPLIFRGAGSLSNTMWPAPRPTSVPSGILMHPTVWPQYTNVTDRQRSDSIGERFTNGRPITFRKNQRMQQHEQFHDCY